MKKKIFSVFCTMLVCILAVLSFVVLTKKKQNDVVFVFGRTAMWVLTGSMEETIPAKSCILIKKVSNPESSIKEGDIITFYSLDPSIKGQLNTHRVKEIDVENKCFITKGDNNLIEDSYPVPYENVVGVYVKKLPLITKFGGFFMTPTGFIVVIVTVFVVTAILFVPGIIKTIKQPADDNLTDYDKEIEKRISEEVEKLKNKNNKNI